LRLVRLSKMLRLAKLKRILVKYQERFDVTQHMEMYVLSVMIMLMAHLLACFFYLVGDASESCYYTSAYSSCMGWDPERPEIPYERDKEHQIPA
jgi:hypothetical protein